ncbi:MAG: HAMP domain-containing histidine kinase [Magnetococcus sp. YQC-5]
MRQTSLQHKVIVGYYIISTLALSLSLFTLVDLRMVSERLLAGEQVYLLLNNVLEMRRFEKNFFLYHLQEDKDQLLAYLDQVRKSEYTAPSLQQTLAAYADLAEHLEDDAAEKRLRILGKALVTAAEDRAAEERQQVHQALELHRLELFVAMIVVVVLIVVLGRSVSKRIVLPLRRIEESMVGVMDGRLESIHIHSNDREILSLTRAFNLVLQELQRRHTHLLRSEKLAALGTLLSGVAHELNNPLSNISSSCQILLEELASNDLDFYKEMLTQIDEQTRRTRDIVRSLLDFSRDRSFHKASLHLAPLIEEVVRFSKGNLREGVRVRVEIPKGLVLHGDRQRLQQAFINLLANAVDAISDAGEVLLRATIPQQFYPASGSRCRPPWVEIVVQDTGKGIAAEHLSRIFDPFFTTKPVGKGSGLGLSVVFEVVEEHEGEIMVESQPGLGSRFVIRLPVVADE